MKEYQYFSKWREEWIAFSQQPPTPGQVQQMEKFHYQISEITITK